jgi:DNA-binding CsgD family transcriptional regulator
LAGRRALRDAPGFGDNQSAMPPDQQINELTRRERECLRLVAQHMHSKEIGRALELSPYTVDKYISSACERLGVRSRREAARLLVSFEERTAGVGEPAADASASDAESRFAWLAAPAKFVRIAAGLALLAGSLLLYGHAISLLLLRIGRLPVF